MSRSTIESGPNAGVPSEERVRAIFSRIAGRYDLFNKLSSLGVDRLWRRALVKACDLGGTEQVLDIASGTGDVAFTIARIGRPRSILATDLVPEMLAVAERKYAASDIATPISFQVVDAQDIPLADESFDVVTVAFGVRNMPDRLQAYREARRVLRPGGRYVILEFSTPPWSVWRALYHLYLRVVIPGLGGLLTGKRADFVYLNDSIREFPQQEELVSHLRDAGFSQVTYRNLSGGIAALHTAIK